MHTHRLRRPCRATTHEEYRVVIDARAMRGRSLAGVPSEQRGKHRVAIPERGAVASPFFQEEGEDHPQQRGEPLLDARDDDLLHRGHPSLRPLHAIIEGGEGHDHLRRCRGHRPHELIFGVNRIQRDEDRPNLPRRELHHEELRAVGEEDSNPVPRADPHRVQCAGEGIALPSERPPADVRPLEVEGRRVGASPHRVVDIVEEDPLRVGRQGCWHAGIIMPKPGMGGHEWGDG